jgi:hypothetical protein
LGHGDGLGEGVDRLLVLVVGLVPLPGKCVKVSFVEPLAEWEQELLAGSGEVVAPVEDAAPVAE